MTIQQVFNFLIAQPDWSPVYRWNENSQIPRLIGFKTPSGIYVAMRDMTRFVSAVYYRNEHPE